MTTLSSSASFTIADAAAQAASATLTVLPAVAAPSGFGRLIHPTLGTFDYQVKPDEWVNVDGDAIIAPVWSSTRTLGGAANALWSGYLRDVVCEERWNAAGGLAMPASQLRMLIAVWSNPVDPANGYVLWYPNYATAVGFKVIPVDLTCGGKGIALDWMANLENLIDHPVVLQLRLVDRA